MAKLGILLLTASLAAIRLGEPLPDEAPAHLALVLRLRDAAGLERLLAAQQDPRSPDYHGWLAPEEFGERFGVDPSLYDRFVRWLEGGGFRVTRYPNRLFLEGVGTVADVRRLLRVQLHEAEADGRRFRTPDGRPLLPPDLAPSVLAISGLDTRTHLRHRHLRHVDLTQGGQALGADDLRLEYDLGSLVAGGQAAAGLTTVVLGTQEGTTSGASGSPGPPFIPPSTTAIEKYFSTISGASAKYDPIVLPNPNADFDTQGSNQEYQLDVEMQSVGAPGAASIALVLSPTSEVFTTGAQYIVNRLDTAVAVSTSLGLCEMEEAENGGGASVQGSEAAVMRQVVQQGVLEGQSWFAAAGDSGADDCHDQNSGTGNGLGGGNATVDFPGTMPEMIDVGGTQFSSPPSSWWNAAGGLAAFQPETTWNEGAQGGGAGGGGQSLFFSKPSWQAGVGPEASDGARDVPDIALEAATATPGVAVYDCGSGQDQSCQGENTGAGNLEPIGGTSVAAPLSAGIFALLAGRLGCRLGDVHATLYALGTAQQAGGAALFHDVTTGNNDYVDPQGQTIGGFQAGPGYDLATGWGSLDVAKLLASWPACQATGGTGSTTGGTSGASGGGSSSGGATAGGTSATGGGSSGGASSSAGASSGGSSGSGRVVGTGSASGASGCSCDGAPGGELALFGAALALGTISRRRRRR